MTSGQVLLSAAEGVATVVIDNPTGRNRLEGRLREDLLDRLRTATADPTVRCVVVTGAGGTFCGGADVDSMVALHEAGDAAEILRRVELGGEVVRTIRSARQPVIAAVDGLAAGAGVGLALACDIRVGSSTARLAPGFVHLGLMPDWGSVDSVVRTVGPAGAAAILLTGDTIEAEEAVAVGLIQRLFPVGFDDEVRALAARIAGAPARAVSAIKEAIGVASSSPDAEGVLALERLRQPALFSDPACGEALHRFTRARDRRSDRPTGS